MAPLFASPPPAAGHFKSEQFQSPLARLVTAWMQPAAQAVMAVAYDADSSRWLLVTTLSRPVLFGASVHRDENRVRRGWSVDGRVAFSGPGPEPGV